MDIASLFYFKKAGDNKFIKMLEINDLHAYYEKSHIIQGISFSIGEGEIVSLLGRNGVGRSTSIKAIMGEVEHTGFD